MADVINKVRIKKQDGTFTNYIPIGAEAKNVKTQDGDSVENKIKKKVYYFDNISNMQTYNLKNGEMAITNGYYNINDGGGGKYQITNDSSLQNDTSGLVHQLNNGLYAKLITENNLVNFKQIGARPQAIDNTKYDNKTFLENFINYYATSYEKPILYIPSGIWYFTETFLQNPNGFTIIGEESTNSGTGTVINAHNDNQNTVWTIGEDVDSPHTKNVNLKGLTFSAAVYSYNNGSFNFSSLKSVGKALRMLHVTYSNFDLSFWRIRGTALSIKDSYECFYNKLFFRHIRGWDSPVINFEPSASGGNNSNSALHFWQLGFELVSGSLINFEKGCVFYVNTIDTIDYEYDYDSSRLIDNESYNENLVTHIPLINIEDGDSSSYVHQKGNIINNININNMAMGYSVGDNVQYVYDTIFYYGSKCDSNWIVNNIASLSDQRRPIILVRNNKETPTAFSASFTLDNLSVETNIRVLRPFEFDVYKFPRIETNNITFSKYNHDNFIQDTLPNREIIPTSELSVKNSYEKGVLCSDADSITDSKLAVFLTYHRQYWVSTGFYTYKHGNTMTLSIHAKIEQNKQYNFRLVGKKSSDETANQTYSEAFTGTGKYEWYTFNTDFSAFSNNQPITFNGDWQSDQTTALVDAIRYF